ARRRWAGDVAARAVDAGRRARDAGAGRCDRRARAARPLRARLSTRPAGAGGRGAADRRARLGRPARRRARPRAGLPRSTPAQRARGARSHAARRLGARMSALRRLAYVSALALVLSGCGSTTDSLGYDNPKTLLPITGPASYPNPFRDLLGESDS